MTEKVVIDRASMLYLAQLAGFETMVENINHELVIVNSCQEQDITKIVENLCTHLHNHIKEDLKAKAINVCMKKRKARGDMAEKCAQDIALL